MSGPAIDEQLNIIVEIISANNILIGDFTSSDPYIKVELKGKEIHKTDKILKTLDPIYTPETKSTFLVSCTAATLFDHGLVFKIKDWDRIGSNDDLGHATVPGNIIYKAKAEHVLEFPWELPVGHESENPGSFRIRCKKAKQSDVNSLKAQKTENLFPTTTADAASAPAITL